MIVSESVLPGRRSARLGIQNRIYSSLGLAAWLMVSGSVDASLVITTDNQFSTNSVAPTWTVATNNLIGGFSPAASSGDFQLESAGGLPVLTDGVIGPITTGHGLFATAGNGGGAGSLLIYQLPAPTNGYNLTNIPVCGGWVDSGRDAQAYVLSFATVANPSSFLPLATVSYNPTGPDS